TADLETIQAAEDELALNEKRWAHLIPTELVPEIMEDRRPREYGMTRWRDFFSSRQLLTTVTILEEIRKARDQANATLPVEQADAIAVYLGLMLGKAVDYNS